MEGELALEEETGTAARPLESERTETARRHLLRGQERAPDLSALGRRLSSRDSQAFFFCKMGVQEVTASVGSVGRRDGEWEWAGGRNYRTLVTYY